MLRWTEAGVEYEPDQRHAEIIIKEMGMSNARAVATPITADPKDVNKLREESEFLQGAEATAYRGLTARVNFLSLDRADLQYAVKHASKHMARPKKYDWIYLKRIAR